MGHRLLPFRQYDENDVINLYAVDLAGLAVDLKLMQPNDDDINADGVVVSVSQGAITDDVVSVTEDSRFQATFASPVGRNAYPTNPLKVIPAASGDAAIGVTLRHTLAVDENGESLLFNPVKKDEAQAVLSGQTVPVLTKGIVTFTADAVDGATVATNFMTPGNVLLVAGEGKVQGAEVTAVNRLDNTIGTILATGNRESKTGTDTWAGFYYICKIDC
jgi:hypothetical protein